MIIHVYVSCHGNEERREKKQKDREDVKLLISCMVKVIERTQTRVVHVIINGKLNKVKKMNDYRSHIKESKNGYD